MTKVLNDLKPASLWNHFEDLCAIPHPSKHEEKIREHIVAWAKGLGLHTVVDEVGNVIIRKPATPGMENRKGIVLQGHIDMVPQKNNDTPHDFEKDPIIPRIDGEWVKATGTTLGADNGIGVAATMAVLEATDLVHGQVEALFTIDEETGMTGAFGLKSGVLTGDILMNLDSEDEGELYVGCAGGTNANLTFHYTEEETPANSEALLVKVGGLKGGHSGVDIALERGNSNIILNRILWWGTNATINATGASSYNWSPAVLNSSNFGAQVIVNPNSTTTYTVTGTNAQGCTSTTTTTINVNSTSFPIFANSVSDTICYGSSTTINATGAVSYNWSPAVSQSTNYGAQVIVNPTTTTTYTITGTNSLGCNSTTTITINVNDVSFPIFAIPLSDTICNGSNTTILAAGANSYSWSPAVSQSQNFGAQVIVNPTTTTTYTITGTNSIGCTSTTTTTIFVNSVSTSNVIAFSDATIEPGTSVQLNATGANNYFWSPSSGLSCTSCQNPTANPLVTTTYIVTGYDLNGCESYDTIKITVEWDCGDLFVPSAFSPNHDNFNDLLFVRGRCIESLDFKIFDRWGEMVFSTTDINIGWDGNFQFKMMNSQVLYYHLNAILTDNTKIFKKGSVSLIR